LPHWNVQTNFGFSMPFDFEVVRDRHTRQTDGQDP